MVDVAIDQPERCSVFRAVSWLWLVAAIRRLDSGLCHCKQLPYLDYSSIQKYLDPMLVSIAQKSESIKLSPGTVCVD
jgi:hypothetical protein